MAEIPMKREDIRQYLVYLLGRVQAAIDWIDKTGPPETMTLQVPEPFEHARWHPGAPPCLLPTREMDDCGPIGVFMGLLPKMPKPKPPGTGKRAKRRK